MYVLTCILSFWDGKSQRKFMLNGRSSLHEKSLCSKFVRKNRQNYFFRKTQNVFFCPKLHSNKSFKPFIYSFSSFFRIWWNVVYRKLTFFLHKIFKPGKIFFGRPNFQNFLLFVNFFLMLKTFVKMSVLSFQ